MTMAERLAAAVKHTGTMDGTLRFLATALVDAIRRSDDDTAIEKAHQVLTTVFDLARNARRDPVWDQIIAALLR